MVRTLAKAAFAAADVPYRTRPGPRILIYHQVGAGLGRQMEVTAADFEFQISWLLAHGEIVDLDTAIARRSDPDAHRLFVLTFDDGYRDVHTRAFPVLRSLGVPFTVYVTTRPVEEGRAMTPGGQAEPLTWSQLEEMAGAGATIGAHTHTHPDMRELDPPAVEAELTTSDQLLEQRLGSAPAHFTYPYGYWSLVADQVVRPRYRTATLGAGKPFTATTDLHLIHRVPVQLGDGRFFFVRKMRSGLKLEEPIRRLAAGYTGP